MSLTEGSVTLLCRNQCILILVCGREKSKVRVQFLSWEKHVWMWTSFLENCMIRNQIRGREIKVCTISIFREAAYVHVNKHTELQNSKSAYSSDGVGWSVICSIVVVSATTNKVVSNCSPQLYAQLSVWTSIRNLQDTSHQFFCSQLVHGIVVLIVWSPYATEFRNTKVRPSLYAGKTLLGHVELKGRTNFQCTLFWHNLSALVS